MEPDPRTIYILTDMIAVDTNLLVYAHRRDAEFHVAAAHQVASLAEGRSAWAIPWPCLHEFFAIATHPKIYDPPSTRDQAIAQIEPGSLPRRYPCSASLRATGSS